jgi:hypothetical protein
MMFTDLRQCDYRAEVESRIRSAKILGRASWGMIQETLARQLATDGLEYQATNSI